MRRSRDYYRNKYLLGELTIGDLMLLVPIEGEFSIGNNWLPLSGVKKSRRRRMIGLSMWSYGTDMDVEFSIDSKVKLNGREVRIIGDFNDDRIKSVRIRLEQEVVL